MIDYQRHKKFIQDLHPIDWDEVGFWMVVLGVVIYLFT